LTEQASGTSKQLNADAEEMLRCEAEFLAGAEANLKNACGRQLQGSHWKTVRDDDSDSLRALMAEHRMYDRQLLKHLPQNRRVVMHGSQRRFLFWKRKTGVAVAAVLAPFEHLLSVDSTQAPPVTLGQLTDHIRRIVGEAKVPHVVGVCSPSGFDPEVLSSRLELPNVTLVLIEPRPGGGWKVTGLGDAVPQELIKLYDPEANAQKVRRVIEAVQERSADLLTGGLSVAGEAQRLGLPEPIVAEGFRQAAVEDGELRVTRRAGDVLLYRGAASRPQENFSMNVVDRIKQLFSSEGDEAQKINVLSERRAALAQRRDRLYEDISKLEAKEADLLSQGRAASSQIVRRRLAAQCVQARKDIARFNTTASMLNQQINIISTDIHNLTLIQQGQMAKLPDTEELTENAVKAEEMLETLKADADLVGGLETGMADMTTSDEELAILKEFEEGSATTTTEPPMSAEEKQAMADFGEPPAEPSPDAPPETKKRAADPEE
jgi:hypothetical protein